MPLAPLADIDAFADWLGESFADTTDRIRAEAVLSRVSSLVRSEAGRTWDGEEVPEEVVAVTLDVSRRVFTNPDNNTRETLDAYSDGRPPEFVGLLLYPREKAVVGRYRAQPRGLWTLRTTRDGDLCDDVQVANW